MHEWALCMSIMHAQPAASCMFTCNVNVGNMHVVLAVFALDSATWQPVAANNMYYVCVGSAHTVLGPC